MQYQDFIQQSKQALKRGFSGLFLFCNFLFLQAVTLGYVMKNSQLTYVCNHGIAFGFRVPQSIFVLMWGIVMIIVLQMLLQRRKASFRVQLPFILIISGALSNVADRFIHGCVIDYITFVPWNIFNLADVSVFVGVTMLLWDMYRQEI